MGAQRERRDKMNERMQFPLRGCPRPARSTEQSRMDRCGCGAGLWGGVENFAVAGDLLDRVRLVLVPRELGVRIGAGNCASVALPVV
jgi:hypothetical protein